MMLLTGVLLVLGIFDVAHTELLGKFVFHGNDDKTGSSLSILHKPDTINFSPNPGPIPADEISSILSLSLGLSIYKDLKWNGLQAGSLFQRPKAVMMLSVDGVPSGETLKFRATEQFPIKMSDEVSSIADIYTMTPSASLPSHVNTIMDGHAKTVSISADEKVAAMGYSNGRASTTAFWSEMTDSWKVVSGDGQSKDSLTKHQILKRISSILSKGFTLNLEEKTVVVNTKELQFSYNLRKQADFMLFSELVYLLWQYEELVLNKKYLKDEVPDVYLLSVSSLKTIEKTYGADSKQMKAALILLQNFIPKIVADFSALYGGNILIVGLEMVSDLSRFEEHKDTLQATLSSLKDQAFDHTFDFEQVVHELHITSKMEHAAREKLCNAVQGALAKFSPSLKFACTHHSKAHRRSQRSLLATANDPKGMSDSERYNLSTYNGMFPVIFNMWFWLLVVLILTTYAISVVMWNMDPGRDSIIYRLTQQRIKSD